jgi:hypothetical protein
MSRAQRRRNPLPGYPELAAIASRMPPARPRYFHRPRVRRQRAGVRCAGRGQQDQQAMRSNRSTRPIAGP